MRKLQIRKLNQTIFCRTDSHYYYIPSLLSTLQGYKQTKTIIEYIERKLDSLI
jgi:hypothetical protein